MENENRTETSRNTSNRGSASRSQSGSSTTSGATSTTGSTSQAGSQSGVSTDKVAEARMDAEGAAQKIGGASESRTQTRGESRNESRGDTRADSRGEHRGESKIGDALRESLGPVEDSIKSIGVVLNSLVDETEEIFKALNRFFGLFRKEDLGDIAQSAKSAITPALRKTGEHPVPFALGSLLVLGGIGVLVYNMMDSDPTAANSSRKNVHH